MIFFKRIKTTTSKLKKIYFSQNFVTEELSPLKSSFSWMCLLLIFQSALVVLLPIPIKEAIDNISNFDVVWKMVLLSFGMGCIALTFDFIEEVFHAKHIVSFQVSIQRKFFEKVLNCKYSYLQTQKSINLVHNISADVRNLELFAKGIWVVSAKAFPTLFFLIGALFLINIYVALVLVIFLILYFIFSVKSVGKLKSLELNLLKERQSFQDLSLQILEFVPVMKSLNLEEKVDRIICQQLLSYDSSLKKQGRGIASVNLSVNSVKVMSRPVILLVGVYAIYLNKISLGELFLVMSYIELVHSPLRNISMFLSPLAKTIASYNRIRSLYQSMEKSLEKERNPEGLMFKGQDIEFKDLALDFISARIPAKGKLNLKLKEGLFYQIRGESGSGKSSFLKILNGFLEPTEGEVFYGGAAYSKIPIKKIRDEIRVVMQEDVLLPFSVKENISLDWEGSADEEMIWDSLRKVNAEKLVRSFPKGLETIIGDSGHQISGGERKRLCLARALYNSESIKVFAFDEPMAGLDPESSRIIYESLRSLAKTGRTVFCVTHKNEDLADQNVSLFFDRDGVNLIDVSSE